MQLTVDHQEINALNANLTRLYGRLNDDLTPVMGAIGVLLVRSTEARFTDKETPSGLSWANLQPSTIKRKGHSQILHHYGELEDSISYDANSVSVTIGSDATYAKYHQVGTVNMVARPFLGLSVDDEIDIIDLINDFISGSFDE